MDCSKSLSAKTYILHRFHREYSLFPTNVEADEIRLHMPQGTWWMIVLRVRLNGNQTGLWGVWHSTLPSHLFLPSKNCPFPLPLGSKRKSLNADCWKWRVLVMHWQHWPNGSKDLTLAKVGGCLPVIFFFSFIYKVLCELDIWMYSEVCYAMSREQQG